MILREQVVFDTVKSCILISMIPFGIMFYISIPFRLLCVYEMEIEKKPHG